MAWCCDRLYKTGCRNSMRQRGKKRLESTGDKNEGVHRSGGRGENSLLSGPGSDLRLVRKKEK